MSRYRFVRLWLGIAVLVAAAPLAHAGTCSNSQINRAYTEVILRPPNGSGISGECNPALYGSYSSLNDLEKKVVAYVNGPHNTPAPVAVASAYRFDSSYNIIDSSGRVVARAGTYNVISTDSASLTPQQAANVISNDGGSMMPGRSVQGTGGRPVFVVNRRR